MLRKIIAVFSLSSVFVYPLTQDEFFQILKKKREILSSGKIYMKVYELKWENIEKYKEFAKELQEQIYSQPSNFKKWFEGKEKGLPYVNKMIKYKKVEYYFEGIEKFPYKKELYIEEIPVEEFKKYIEYVKEKHKKLKISFPVKIEYLWDGTTLKEYEIYFTEEYGGENVLTILPDETETTRYFKLWFIDYSFAFLENLQLNKNFKFSYKDGKIILNEGKLIFESSFSCGCIYVGGYNKKGNLAREFISGCYSLINNIIHLPCFSSDAKILNNGEVEQNLYVIEKYELRPLSKEEFSLKIITPTKIIDYSLGIPPKIYYYKKGGNNDF